MLEKRFNPFPHIGYERSRFFCLTFHKPSILKIRHFFTWMVLNERFRLYKFNDDLIGFLKVT